MNTNIPYPNHSAAILAGGTNSRFNGNTKSLISLWNKPILEHQTDVLKTLFPEIMLITNSPDKFANYKVLMLYTDLIPCKGPLSGIHTALKQSSHDWVFIIAEDMPFINAQTITRQLEVTGQDNCEAIIPLVKNSLEPLHGVYHKKGINKLEWVLHSDNSPSVRKFLDTIHTCYWKIYNETPFTNINTPEELERYEKSTHHQNRKW